ncbi:SH3 domain-containing protein [Aliiruegeria haliotis]|uniref:SH3 domain-containing protein n=1 Tax=Aliiruegeria haliotis TaxID=1280846 RepID=A0A2T0RXW9_9RHOB|nr:SH3 domain-containing protein [Aliiruegeria haliotis]PRY26025.1 SH3 domain-containing protein [Aliiruegeria haliotis]
MQTGHIAAAAALSILFTASTALAASISVVSGVDEGDMLKLRAGPGMGYRVIVGLPNGTQVRNLGCDRVGGTPWCKVSLKEARALKGYVSGHYLQSAK